MCVFQGSKSDAMSIGGFGWNLIFTWHAPNAYEKSLKKYPTDPMRYGIDSTFYYCIV